MILKVTQYIDIVRFIDKKLGTMPEFRLRQNIIEEFEGIHEDTLKSIFLNRLKKRDETNNKICKTDVKNIIKMYNEAMQNDESGILTRLGQKYNISPMSIVKLIIENVHMKKWEKGIPILLNQENIKFPSRCTHEQKQSILISEMMNNPSCMMDGALASELWLVYATDIIWGPLHNLIRLVTEDEFKEKLHKKLISKGITFKTESDLRSMYNQDNDRDAANVNFDVDNALHSHNVGLDDACELYTKYVDSDEDHELRTPNSDLDEDNKLHTPDVHLDLGNKLHNSEVDACEDSELHIPDVVLDVAVSVDFNIVKWIVSKAEFFDEMLHQSDVLKYRQYFHRFGSGLVIYWFGYLEHIDPRRYNEFLIYSEFPSNIIQSTESPKD